MFDWDTDVRPVIVAIYKAMKEAAPDSGVLGPVVESAEINKALDRDDPDPHTNQVLRMLSDAGYLNDQAFGTMDGRWKVVRLSERGLQEVAGWPATPGGDYATQLLDLLDERIEHADDADERGRLSRFREAITAVGTGVVTNVLSDLARR